MQTSIDTTIASHASQVVTRALQLHPTVPGLWMYSAAWELEANLNVEGARALMQRGLRMCNSSQQLWIEYFKMEMKAMQKLKARRLLLGLGPDAGKVAGNKDIITPSLASVRTQSDGDGEGGGQILADSPEDKLSLLLARQILKNAVSAIQANLQFRMQFVEVLRGLEFKWRGMVEDEVYEEMKRDFGDMAECVDLHARRCMENGKAKDTNEVYKAAVEVSHFVVVGDCAECDSRDSCQDPSIRTWIGAVFCCLGVPVLS